MALSKKDRHHYMLRDTLVVKLHTPEDDEAPIYMCGSFNEWSTKDNRFQFTKTSPNHYELEIPSGTHLYFPVEYKYTRGDWESVELHENGHHTNNRILSNPTTLVNDFVPKWAQSGKSYDEKLLPQIKIIAENFEIPQLIKTRRITALLPHNYYETDKRYPVLYLQDGQNLFDDYATYGSWGVDKKLAELAAKGLSDVIIIAIDHANEDRISEFTPSVKNAKFNSGEGKKYIRFLADTLKPYIDKNFRTLPDVTNTGIGGSSMGGLISIYAGLVYPEVYSKLMIFSPSLWVMPDIYFGGIQLSQSFDSKIYLYAGGRESENMVPNVHKFQRMVTERGKEGSQIDFHLSLDPNGTHSEYHWGQEFPKAIKWLFYNQE